VTLLSNSDIPDIENRKIQMRSETKKKDGNIYSGNTENKIGGVTSIKFAFQTEFEVVACHVACSSSGIPMFSITSKLKITS